MMSAGNAGDRDELIHRLADRIAALEAQVRQLSDHIKAGEKTTRPGSAEELASDRYCCGEPW